MLKFMIGRACSGKTHKIIETVAEKSVDKKVVLIVPEQFSFESERAIIKYKNAVLDNISVLSFSRVFDFVAEASGIGASICVSEFEKMILIKKALIASSEQLGVFSRYVGRSEFVKNIHDTIRDLKFAGATIEDIVKAASSIGGTCGAKLKDIACVMSTYDALLNEKYIDPVDKLTKLNDILSAYEYFKDTDVFFDSFTGFTGQQYKVIEKILKQADNVTFSFCADNPEDTSPNVFYNTCFSVKKIKSLLPFKKKDDISVEILKESYYSNDSMRDLEKLMFSSAKDCMSMGNINIVSCNNSREETLAACNIIRNEIKENGYRFKDFILVARNSDTYADNVLRQCEKHDIACYSDRKYPLAYTPLCAYVLGLIEAASNMNCEKVLNFLKIGLLDISDEEIFELENYIYIWDIDSSGWENDWDMSVKGLTADRDFESDKLRLSNINNTRKKVYEIISEFKKKFSGTPQNRAEAIYKHLTRYKIDKNLARYCESLSSDNELYLASVIKQSWDSFISVLDSIVRVLDKSAVSSTDFLDSLRIAMDSVNISNIPQMLDEVTFGSADRIRPSKPKISIILGCNQGVFPKIGKSVGLLASGDKEKLKKHDINLDDDAIKGAIEENFLVYSMLCCPVDKVYILYSEKDSSGCELTPSAFVARIKEAFSDLEIKKFSLSCDGDFYPSTKEVAFSEIGLADKRDYLNIKNSLKDYSDYYERLDSIETASKSMDFSLSQATADKLFGKEIRLSATYFDYFQRCSLFFLLRNGFSAKKLEKADLGVMQRGTITHYVLERIVEKYKSDLGKLSPVQISTEVDMLIHEYFCMVKGSEKLMTARFSYLLNKIAEATKLIVSHLVSEFAQSDFVPAFCELSIGNDGDIPAIKYDLFDGSVMSLGGKIDRVDTYKNFVRVVDYKTGKVTFKLSDTIAGLNMQMLLYLYAFVKNGQALVENPSPAGILYMPAKLPSKPADLRMNGIVLDDDEIRTAMEKDNKGRYIPKSNDDSSFLDNNGFELVFKHIDNLVVEMGNSIKKGEFSADPVDSSTSEACKYCDYSGICRKSNLPHAKAEILTNSETVNILRGDEDNGI